MAVNKGVSLKRKKELEEPDEIMIFLSKCMRYYVEHKKKFSIVLAGLITLIVVTGGLRLYATSSEKKAFETLDQQINTYQALAAQKGEYAAYLDTEKGFQTLLEKYASRVAGRMATVIYANICYTNGNYDKAVELYEEALTFYEQKTMEPYKNLILSGLGYAYEGKQDYKKAGEYFEMIVAGDVDFMKDDALFNLGRIYAAAGETEKSRKAFETIMADYSDSMYVKLVKERLAL